MRRLHAWGYCLSCSEMIFMHFQNSCTRNCDYHIPLIMTGSAHKESSLKLLLILILVREKELYIIKTDCSDKMVVAFTIKEKTIYWQAYFPMRCYRFPIYICGITFLIWLHYLSYFPHSDKNGSCSLYNQLYKLLWLWFYVDFFLNLGFYTMLWSVE